MGESPECSAEITGERADIGSLADKRFTFGMIPVRDGDEPQLGDFDQTRRWRWRGARPCEFVGALPTDFDRRIRRGALSDRTDKARYYRFDRLWGRT